MEIKHFDIAKFRSLFITTYVLYANIVEAVNLSIHRHTETHTDTHGHVYIAL